MKKYLIVWDIGFGEDYEVIECDNGDLADKQAYEMWREACENNANYSARKLTSDLAEDYGLEDELEK